MDTLYFDGQCALCSREIRFLKKYAKTLSFVDIHSLDDTHKPDKESLLKTLHLQTENQEWLTGVDATVQSWSHTPYGWIMRILKWPFINTIAQHAYAYWANKRYCKLYQPK